MSFLPTLPLKLRTNSKRQDGSTDESRITRHEEDVDPHNGTA